MPYRLYLCLVHSIPSPMLMQHMHQPWSTNDMIHFILPCDLVRSLILTSLALHHCLRPSAPSLAQTSPSRGPSLQSLQLALHACNRSIKPSLVLIFSTLVTWLHVMSHMQWALSCVILATNPSHLHHHDMSCSHKCTFGLITYVSYI